MIFLNTIEMDKTITISFLTIPLAISIAIPLVVTFFVTVAKFIVILF